MSEPSAGASPWRLRIGATVVSVLVALSLGELLLRAARPPALSVLQYPCVYQEDAGTGYAYVPGATGLHAGHFEFENPVEINSLGFFDAEPEANATPRILAVGDSFTAALAMPREEVWTTVLERELRARGHPEADVVNLGLDGSGTGAQAAILERFVSRFDPDVVLLAFYANDVEDVLRPQMRRECHRGYVLAYPSDPYRDALRARVDGHLEGSVGRFLHRHAYLARLFVALTQPPMNPYRIGFLQPRLAAIEPKEDPKAGVRRWRDAVSGSSAWRRVANASSSSCRCRRARRPAEVPRSGSGAGASRWPCSMSSRSSSGCAPRAVGIIATSTS